MSTNPFEIVKCWVFLVCLVEWLIVASVQRMLLVLLSWVALLLSNLVDLKMVWWRLHFAHGFCTSGHSFFLFEGVHESWHCCTGLDLGSQMEGFRCSTQPILTYSSFLTKKELGPKSKLNLYKNIVYIYYLFFV